MLAETWKAIPGFPGYEASDLGRVRSLDRRVAVRPCARFPKPGTRFARGRVLTPIRMSDGHLFLNLHDPVTGKERPILIHRLVMFAFVGPCPPRHECLHRNGVPHDNRLENLRWGSRSENVVQFWDHSGRRGRKPVEEHLVDEARRRIAAGQRLDHCASAMHIGRERLRAAIRQRSA